MRRRLVDRERVVGERRAVVRRGRKHTREHFQKERGRSSGEIFFFVVSHFRVLRETLKYFVLVERPFLPFGDRPHYKLLEREKRHHNNARQKNNRIINDDRWTTGTFYHSLNPRSIARFD